MSSLGDIITAKIKARNAAYDRLKQGLQSPEEEVDPNIVQHAAPVVAQSQLDPETKSIQEMADREGLQTTDLSPDEMENRRDFMTRPLNSQIRGNRSRLLSMR